MKNINNYTKYWCVYMDLPLNILKIVMWWNITRSCRNPRTSEFTSLYP